MINYSECRTVLDDTRMHGMHLDILKNNGFNIDNIIKIDIYNNKIEFSY